MNHDNIQDIQRTLFGFSPQKLKKHPNKLASSRMVVSEGWHLEPHVCKNCFGRVASVGQTSSDGAIRYLCTNCGDEGVGRSSSVICACGIKLHSQAEGKRVGPANRDAWVRCITNPKRSPEFPSEYVASYINESDRKKT